MFRLFRKSVAPLICPIDIGRSQDCAILHAACFAFPWPQSDIEALLAAPTTVADGALGARNDLHGFILTRLAADEAEVLTIAVAPRRRGKGIAAGLMRANMKALAAKGAKSLFLEVEAENVAALALYRRLAFETVGERKSYYRKPDGSSALAFIMRRALT